MAEPAYTQQSLEAAFREGLGADEVAPGVGERVSAYVATALERFGADLEALRLAHDLGRRVERWADPAERALEEIRSDEVALCAACALGHSGAQTEFERSYLRKAAATLHRLDLDRDMVEEITQQLRLRTLFPKEGQTSLLDRFYGKGRLSSWLRVSITQMARRYLTRRKLHEELEEAMEQSAAVDPELSFLRQEYRPVFIAGLRAAVAELDPKRRFVLALNVVDRVSADTIGRMLSVHRATVFRWLDTTRSEIFASTRAHVLSTLDISDAEFERIAGQLLSQLDISLVQYLAADPGGD